MNTDRIITIIADGSVIGTVGGPAGWAVLIVDGNDRRLESGCMPYMGNNEAELFAIAMGLLFTPPRSRILVWSDSKWALSWVQGRKPSNPHIKAIKRTIFDIMFEHQLVCYRWQRVKDHANNIDHNRVDTEARRQANLAYDALVKGR